MANNVLTAPRVSDVGPLVSVVIPAYQAGRYVAAAVESLLAQTHRHLELIVVDDGSTDDTARILQRYVPDPRVRIIFQANAGQSAAANRGFRASRGEFVKFFDADDLLSPDAIALQVAALASALPGQLAYGEWARFHGDPAEAVFSPQPGYHDGSPLEWLLSTWEHVETMYQCALWLIPRGLIERAGGWDERISLINDFEFFTRLVLASAGVVHTPGARVYYRSGLSGSLSRDASAKAIASAHLSCRTAVQQLLAAEDSPRVRRVCADALMTFVQAHYPACRELMADALMEIERLGGSPVRPGGGRAFRCVARVFGWRAALRLRRSMRLLNASGCSI